MITKKSFGKLPDGREADLYVLTNCAGASVEITNYGGILRAITVPDKDGNLGNVLLGYNDVSGYVPCVGYMGALIGRVGNRICRGECELSGEKLTLAKNEGGLNHLHGGIEGFDKKFWDATPVEGICEDSLILRYTSADGEEGYPGTLKVMVTYTFTDENELILRYEAVCDKDTLCSLTNHAYFNLEGEASGKTVDDHIVEMNADTYLATDAELIPTGELAKVENTPMDLREGVRLGDVFEQEEDFVPLVQGHGIDHCYNVNDPEAGLRFACAVTAPGSGRMMQVFTDMPAIQLYTGNGLAGVNKGSSGRVYGKREGLCLETQYQPDAINHPEFEDSVLYAGEKYDFTTVFTFDTLDDDE